MDQGAFKAFFEPYAKNVDQADKLAFWKLSDALIMAIIMQELPASLVAKNVILDAGGGTARWSVMLSQKFHSRFIVYDLSEDMLAQAKNNIRKAGLEERIQLVQGDLTDMNGIGDSSVDHALSIYNPISFIDKCDRAIQELYRVIKPGGKAIIMGQGYHNALFSKINNYTAPHQELKALEGMRVVRWAPHVPPLHVFAKGDLEDMIRSVGFSAVTTYGIPVFAQPGPEDFDSSNASKSKISLALENPEFFKTVFDIEMKHNRNPETVNRGMNLFVVGQKG